MKNYLIPIILFYLVFLEANESTAQKIANLGKDLIEKGDKEFQKFAYGRALEYYKESHKEDSSNSNIYLKVADSYRLLNDQFNAENWYKRYIDKSKSIDAIVYYRYARALESNKKYEESKLWYEKYGSLNPTDERVERKLKGLNQISTYYRDSGYYQITPIRVNSKAQDFSPTYYKEGLVFVSGRKSRTIIKGVFNWDNSSYLDLYYSEVDEDEHMKEPSKFNRRVNTKYHEGPLAFYDDDQKVIFTRNNYNKGKEGRSSDDINKLKMYFSESVDGAWTNIKPFKYNDKEYSVGHPTISKDGQRLIFASDMPGSLGGTDLWYCYQTQLGWSEPKNLGVDINTSGNEMFPYWNEDKLYFSSDGYEGLGGLDVYEVNYDGINTKGRVRNLGSPLNSSKDDFGYVSKDKGQSGYFSSNRLHELYDDIYHFKYTKPQKVFVRGLVEDEKDLSVISPANIYLLDEITGDTIKAVVNDRKGRFEFELDWDRNYKIIAAKKDYELIKAPSVSTFDHNDEEVIVLMRKIELLACVIAVDETTGLMIPKPHIIVLHPEEGHSLVPVDIDVDTSVFIIKPNITYDVAGAKRQYFTKHVDRFSGTKENGTVFWVVPLGEIELDKAIKLDNIYYDLNKWDIRPDAATELDKLVETLKSNPTVKIELSSHTDSRGKDEYNKWLSQKRAESAVQYLVKQGISNERLVAKGYGEEKIINRCANDIKCSKVEHQENRRTEFKVTSY